MLATSAFSTHMIFPTVQQSAVHPIGEHKAVYDDHAFPHKDNNGDCWWPADYESYKGEDKETTAFVDYMDPKSEIYRETCASAPVEPFCSIQLSWEKVDCDIYDKKKDSVKKKDDEPWTLPWYVSYPVMFLSGVWKFHVIFAVTLPWWLLLATVAALDWIIDWPIWLLFGWWCVPCAGVFIWLINIAMLPFHILAWLQRFRLETYGLMIDGWLLFFNFSGCYLRFGRQCFWDRSIGNRDVWTVMDMPLFFVEESEKMQSLLSKPALETPEDIWTLRRENRQVLLSLLPFYDEVSYITQSISGLFDL